MLKEGVWITMKRLTPILSALLAAALIFITMPIAQAAVTLASVHEGTYATRSITNDWSGPVLDGELNLFSGFAKLRPGSNNAANRYKFVLVNAYSKPIEYTYTHEAVAGPGNAILLPLEYTLYRSGVLTPVPATGLTGMVPVGGYVEFELEWAWPIDDGSPADLGEGTTGWSLDTPFGTDSVRRKYQAELKFFIEADEDTGGGGTVIDGTGTVSGGKVTLIWQDGDGTELGRWENLKPGMTIAEALALGYVFPGPLMRPGFIYQGFRDKDGVLVVSDYVIAAGAAADVTVVVKCTWEPMKKEDNITLIWLDEDGTELGRWENLTPGMTIGEALALGYVIPEPPARPDYTFQGYKDKDGNLIDASYRIADGVPLTAELILEVMGVWKVLDLIDDDGFNWIWIIPGIIGIGGAAGGIAALGSLGILGLTAVPVIGAAGWLLHRACDRDCGRPGCPKAEVPDVPGYETPPKTGDSWTITLLAGTGMLLAMGTLIALKRRKREA